MEICLSTYVPLGPSSSLFWTFKMEIVSSCIIHVKDDLYSEIYSVTLGLEEILNFKQN